MVLRQDAVPRREREGGASPSGASTAAAAGLAGLPDAGNDGASPAIQIPAKQRRYHPPPSINARTRNMLLRSVRCRGERGFALLKGRWRTLKRITASAGKTGDITRAALVLTHFEHGYLE